MAGDPPPPIGNCIEWPGLPPGHYGYPAVNTVTFTPTVPALSDDDIKRIVEATAKRVLELLREHVRELLREPVREALGAFR